MVEPNAEAPLAGRRVLLGVTGGIAAYKAVLLARVCMKAGATVQVVMTQAATRFVGPDTFTALTGLPARTDVFEEVEHVLHVRMAHEADVAVVAPATANVIARLALGLADDMVTSTLLEARCPVVIAPAMHTGMYEHPATQEHLATLRSRGAVIVGPAVGSLAAGDEGLGRMSEPDEILAAVIAAVGSQPEHDLAGRTILVTAGPTHEPIDPVRFIGNNSSGRMGYAVAREAAARGARVILVSGPVAIASPPDVEVVDVTTAQEMRDAVMSHLDRVDAVVKAAAVADWRPAGVAGEKLKKDAGAPQFDLVPTPDILAELGRSKGDRVLVGFAAETENLEAAGRRKLESKGLDLIVVNQVGREGTGFGSETNDAMILSSTGDDEPMRSWTKPELAGAILDRVAKLLAERA
ncbi:MAG TPA: bifunctional phosphopantothenoylcysteine decarboxylase/phosphopantothenate--cysteine ligase CoaBC [Actinomycetota bacterium]|nr:bifunctional phosphopantothenoylcysteine decarboxylase/phosphopantothenate--cysteine ligase CoaBC [Actinomycetota bacterium]